MAENYGRTPKTTVFYDQKDPHSPSVTYAAIQTMAEPFYVHDVYLSRRKPDLPNLPADILIVPSDMAQRLSDFQRGNIDDLVS
ncbi:MAG TPA: hypothetical protein VJB12_00705 [Candidatus Nanoarchaeia archaeon]|nr:hypothetical protein [Candidatus Nanoarchaeia archaeon]